MILTKDYENKIKALNMLVNSEQARQNNGIELIASENFASDNVRYALSTVLTNKYAEGYPGRRYYGGCKYIDKIEQIAINEACNLFKVKYANVQPHSGSQANYAAYRALMPKGGKVLALRLDDGGHLTHGSSVSFSSRDYDFFFYPLKNGRLDYETIAKMAMEIKPNVILAGFSAYPYFIDWKKFREIADSVGAYFMVDMAHIAGIVAAGLYETGNPCDYADIVTSTTHKTLRGPRGGLILTNNEELAKKINSAVFPYAQGGPLENTILAKAHCFIEAQTADFKEYMRQVLTNTRVAAERLGCSTDTHLFLLNTWDRYGMIGAAAQELLEQADITTNKNMQPGDTLSPRETSGLRLGFAASTTRFCNEQNAIAIADLIDEILAKRISVVEAKKKVQDIIFDWASVEDLTVWR